MNRLAMSRLLRSQDTNPLQKVAYARVGVFACCTAIGYDYGRLEETTAPNQY